MKQETKNLIDNFHAITHVMPKSARMGVGSMKEFISFTVSQDEKIKDFIKVENFRENNKLNGLKISFVDNYSDGTVVLTVLIANIRRLLEEKSKLYNQNL